MSQLPHSDGDRLRSPVSQFATVALATLFAASVGVSSAYLGGAYDLAVQRVVDAWMSFPALVVILSPMAALGPGWST